MVISSSFVLGVIGNVISLLMFLSPIKTFKQVVKKRSTENYDGIPYITTLLSTSLWTFYGVLKPGGLLVATVNGAGAALHVAYIIIFIIYAPKTIRVKSVKLVAALDVGFLGAVIIVTMAALRQHMRLTLVGLICTALTIAMYAAPLSSMKTVIKTKSVEYMPFFLSFFQFLNGGVWSGYALLVKDYYLGVPNGIGFFLGSAQLILYAIYKTKKDEVRMEDEGSARLFNGAVRMQAFDHVDDAKTNLKNRSLDKGNSLPKPSIVRQYSQNITKTISLSPYEWGKFNDNDDVEKGLKDGQ